MNYKIVFNALGLILIGFGIITLTPIIIAVLEREYNSIIPFIVASCCSVGVGTVLHKQGGWKRNFDRVKRNEGMLIVALAWISTATIAAIPYLFYQLSPLDAYFEAISGLTTTGATILINFSEYPKDFFFWRSLSQWLGGMGIIVLVIAIMPQFAVAGRKMFFTEAPGPTEEKITPRITHTAKALWFIYLLLTVIEVSLLKLSGMPLFDSICNALSTMAAGGFSPNPQSIMGYDNSVAIWIVTLFMFLAGTNFALQYRVLIKVNPKPLLKSEEFQLYVIVIVILSGILAVILKFGHDIPVFNGIRDSTFQVVSIITTTGFSSVDFALWVVPAQVVLVILMFFGGCAGSAGGGIKVVRVLFIWKYLKREIYQVLHPKAVLPIKVNKTSIPKEIQRQIIGFLAFYIVFLVGSSLLVTVIEGDATIGFLGTAATLGNIGPGFGDIGPMGTFGHLTSATKIIFIVDMVVGRLELIPILVMLHPDFWL